MYSSYDSSVAQLWCNVAVNRQQKSKKLSANICHIHDGEFDTPVHAVAVDHVDIMQKAKRKLNS
jgi:hypothetical protein